MLYGHIQFALRYSSASIHKDSGWQDGRSDLRREQVPRTVRWTGRGGSVY